MRRRRGSERRTSDRAAFGCASYMLRSVNRITTIIAAAAAAAAVVVVRIISSGTSAHIVDAQRID
jgi:hypothetical protein